MRLKAFNVFWTGICVVVAIILALVLTQSCVNAPRSVEDLVAMPQPAFENWRDRAANGAKIGSQEYTAHHGGAAMVSLASAIRVIASVGQPGDLSSIAKGYDGLLSFALLEVAAYADAYLGDAAAAPRIKELLAAVADGIESGASEPRPSK